MIKLVIDEKLIYQESQPELILETTSQTFDYVYRAGPLTAVLGNTVYIFQNTTEIEDEVQFCYLLDTTRDKFSRIVVSDELIQTQGYYDFDIWEDWADFSAVSKYIGIGYINPVVDRPLVFSGHSTTPNALI